MRAAFLPVFAFLFASCQGSDTGPSDAGERISTIQISGRQNFSGGAPLKAAAISYRLSVEGDELFSGQGGACATMPGHGGGLFLGTASPQADGTYRLDVPISSIRAAVVPSCALSSLTSKQLQGLKLSASLAADSENCATYCAGTQPDDPGCVDDCSKGKRLLQAVHPVSDSELKALVSGINNGVLKWSRDLVFTRLGPPLSDGDGVDLHVSAAATALSARVSREMFQPDSCETNHSCIHGSGLRTLLRFDAVIENLGTTDLILGDPSNNPLFERHECHNHFHLKNVLLYELVYPSTGQVVSVGGDRVVGEKTSFCMMDMDPVVAGATSQGYDCDNQGISSGWSDTYESSLECQFLDVTGVAPGAYLLRTTVNPDGELEESDPSNNVTEVPVTIT